jgi:hypothetical protein
MGIELGDDCEDLLARRFEVRELSCYRLTSYYLDNSCEHVCGDLLYCLLRRGSGTRLRFLDAPPEVGAD